MQPLVKNQKGYVLIMVLLIIVIIAIMTPPVISKIMSSSTQFQKVEEDLQLEKLGDMGILYTDKAIDRVGTEGDRSIRDLMVLKNKEKPSSNPSKTEIENSYKESFKEEVSIFFPLSCPKELGVSDEYKCTRVMKMEDNELYKFQVASKVDPLATIDYLVFMTVKDTKDQINGNPIVIEIPIS